MTRLLISVNRRALAAAAAFVGLSFVACPTASAQITPGTYFPTAEEQYVTSLINRARHAPNGLSVLSMMVSNNLGSISASSSANASNGTPFSANFWTSNTPGVASAMNFFQVNPGDLKFQFNALPIPNRPLAWHPAIGNVASKYNDIVIADAGATANPHAVPPYHGPTGFADRFNDGGYTGWSGVGENAFRQYSGNGAYSFAAFMIDWGGNDPGGDGTNNGIQDGTGHRNAIMSTGFRDVGVSIKPGYGGAGNMASIQHFGTRSASTLTGIVFNDNAPNNSVFDGGEGLGGVTITATPVGGGGPSVTTTWSAGGFSVDLANGTYNVSASGPFGTQALGQVIMAGQNVQLNVVNPVPEPGALGLLGIVAAATLRRRTRQR